MAETIENNSSGGGKAFAVLLFLLELGILFAYGFAGSFFNSNSLEAADYQTLSYIFLSMLAILGYGLIISYFKNGILTGMATTLLIVSINVQLGPLIHKFWYNVFMIGFQSKASNSSSIAGLGYYFQRSQNILLSVYMEKIVMIMSVSLLTACTGFIGRLGALQTLFVTLIFNRGWPLAFMASFY
jgi:hypothetical protein